MLKPGVEYTYETVEGVTWATDTTTGERRIIGWEHPIGIDDQIDTGDSEAVYAHLKEEQLWKAIRAASKTNKSLQNALEECIIIYKLSKEYKDGI
jgi:hypothetical protein